MRWRCRATSGEETCRLVRCVRGSVGRRSYAGLGWGKGGEWRRHPLQLHEGVESPAVQHVLHLHQCAIRSGGHMNCNCISAALQRVAEAAAADCARRAAQIAGGSHLQQRGRGRRHVEVRAMWCVA